MAHPSQAGVSARVQSNNDGGGGGGEGVMVVVVAVFAIRSDIVSVARTTTSAGKYGKLRPIACAKLSRMSLRATVCTAWTPFAVSTAQATGPHHQTAWTAGSTTQCEGSDL